MCRPRAGRSAAARSAVVLPRPSEALPYTEKTQTEVEETQLETPPPSIDQHLFWSLLDSLDTQTAEPVSPERTKSKKEKIRNCSKEIKKRDQEVVSFRQPRRVVLNGKRFVEKNEGGIIKDVRFYFYV